MIPAKAAPSTSQISSDLEVQFFSKFKAQRGRCSLCATSTRSNAEIGKKETFQIDEICEVLGMVGDRNCNPRVAVI